MSPLVIVPLGSWEQHGAHLPASTDSVIICAVVARAAHGRDVTVAPVMNFTASDEHAGFPFTLSAGTEATAASLVAIARSAAWARGIVFANGHGGNADALRIATSAMDHEGLRHAVWSLPAYAGSDAHAGRTETSVMLHLAPSEVRMDLATTGNTQPTASLVDGMRSGGVRAVSDNGVLGDPTQADAAHGAAVMDMWVGSFSSFLDTVQGQWS